jgi:hypothetical protein
MRTIQEYLKEADMSLHPMISGAMKRIEEFWKA